MEEESNEKVPASGWPAGTITAGTRWLSTSRRRKVAHTSDVSSPWLLAYDLYR
jgi:hypothetical protein